MKTLNTILKMTSIILLLTVLASTTLQLNAQESDEQKKEVKIKMIKIVDGEETVIDTTFEITSLEDFEGLEDIDVIIGDELIENLGVKLNELKESGEVDVQVMTIETDGDGTEHTMIITKEIEETIGEDGESIQIIDLIVEVADSLDNAKVIRLQMDGEEHAVFISDDEEMKTIETEDGKKTIIIKHKGEGDEDILIMNDNEVDWHEKMGSNVRIESTEDGNKVIVTEENGEVKEYIIKDGDGAYIIDEEGNLTKVDGDKDFIWTEKEGDNIWVDIESEGDNKMIVVKSMDGEINMADLSTEQNVFIENDVDGGEKEVFVNVIKKKEGDETIIIKTKIIIESLDEEDKETLEKAGVNLVPESEENKLEVESLQFSPNPNNGKFKLKFTTPEEGNTAIKIYDIKGAEVYNESLKNFSGAYEKEIDISGEKSGTYFLKVAQGENVMSRKIIVE